MKIKGIAKGDKDLRHFTFDDNDYIEKEGHYYYKVNYGKNPLEGEGAEDEIGFIECDKVMPLGGQKPKAIQPIQNKDKVLQSSSENHTHPRILSNLSAKDTERHILLYMINKVIKF